MGFNPFKKKQTINPNEEVVIRKAKKPKKKKKIEDLEGNEARKARAEAYRQRIRKPRGY